MTRLTFSSLWRPPGLHWIEVELTGADVKLMAHVGRNFVVGAIASAPRAEFVEQVTEWLVAAVQAAGGENRFVVKDWAKRAANSIADHAEIEGGQAGPN